MVAAEGEFSSFENPMHNRSSIDEEFENDSVVVVLDPVISQINKLHNKDFFDEVEIESIIDLTKRSLNMSSKNDEFKQILQLNLKDKTKENVLRSIVRLEQISGVLSAEPNYLYSVSVEPNDPDYLNGNLWGLDRVNGISASRAWGLTRGDSNVRVGIIDTGIANHDDLNANLVAGRDTYNNDNITNDDTNSHGTHVAGTVEAVGNNGIGVAGVNWNVSLVPLQAANASNTFSATNVVSAIGWAQDRWGTDEQISILNYSVGGFGNTIAVRAAISEYNGLFVWSAGNETEDVDARIRANGNFNLDNLISVGSLTYNSRSLFSNYSTNNENVHIYAPGSSIYSTVPTWYASSGYSYKSGTSMAAPHVSGVAALMLSANPDMTGGTGLTLGARLKHAIINNSDTISITIPDGSGGSVFQNVKSLDSFMATSAVTFTTSLTTGGVSINGFRNGFNLPMNTQLELPHQFAPLGMSTQQMVTSIADSAFIGQDQMTDISIPVSVTSIGSKAFMGCSSLNSIYIRDNISSIGDGAFAGCNNLNITVAASNPNYCAEGNILYNKAKTKIIAAGKIAAEITVPDTVTEIAPHAFENNANLSKLRFVGTPLIGANAFAGCENMYSVYFDSYNVPTVSSGGFSDNTFILYTRYNAQAAYRSVFSVYTNNIVSIEIQVVFISDGSSLNTISVYNGSTITDLTDHFRTGCTFGGWYDNDSYEGEPYENGGLWESEENLTLYAKWIGNEYVVTLNANGGILEGSSHVDVTYGSAFSTLSTANREGYTFEGWYDADGKKYMTADGESTVLWDKAESVILYAEWSIESYEIQISDNGSIVWLGAAGIADDSCSIEYGTVINASDIILTFKNSNSGFKNGMIFDHFEIDGYSFDWESIPDLGINGDIKTITPIWIAETHTINFDTRCDLIVDAITADYDANITLPDVPRTGRIFNGWYTSIEYETEVLWTKMPDLTPNVQNNGSTMLYAKWTKIQYSIEYDSNYGYGTMNSVVHTYDVPKNLSDNLFSKTNYNFKGWSTTRNGSVVYTNGQSVCNLSSVQGAVIPLFAVWTPNVYNITYLNLRTTHTIYATTHTYGTVTKLVAPYTYNSNEKFKGFYASKSSSVRITQIAANTVNPVVYIEWDILVTGFECASQITIKDTGRFKQHHETILAGINNSFEQSLINDYKYLRVDITMTVWEKYDGYQYIFLYSQLIDDKNDTYKLVEIPFEHGSGYKNTNKESHTFTAIISLEKVKSLDNIYLLYGASGGAADDWCREDLVVNMYLTNNK